jgi:hypothetical protein
MIKFALYEVVLQYVVCNSVSYKALARRKLVNIRVGGCGSNPSAITRKIKGL